MRLNSDVFGVISDSDKIRLRELLREEGGVELPSRVVDAIADELEPRVYRRGESIVATGEVDCKFRVVFEGWPALSINSMARM